MGSALEEFLPSCGGGKLVYFYINRPNDLRNLFLMGQGLVEVAALLGVRKVLTLEDLEFPILLYESEDANTLVLEHGAYMGSTHASPLYHG